MKFLIGLGLLFLFFLFLDNEIEINKIKTDMIFIEREINEIKNAATSHQKVIITGYHPASKGINADSNHKVTATMDKPKAGWTVAISTELVNMGWLGKKIYIDGYGIRKANDRMNINLDGKRIDICMPTLKEAKKINKENVLAVVLH